MLFPWLPIFDIFNIRANFKKPIDIESVQTRNDDFTLLIPIFNDINRLTNVDFLKKYRDKVILCTTTNETPEFLSSLKKLCDKYGFKATYSDINTGKKNPWTIYNKTLLAHDVVLRESISTISSEYVIFMDGDTYVDGDLEVLTGALEEKGYDIASVKVLPSKRKTLIEKLQGVEYDIAMQARLIYPWLTSGAGMVAKRSIMVSTMKNHSLFFDGGDIEIGELSDMMGYKVGHIPMIFYTEVPHTVSAWIKQRFSWMCGMFRHSIVNIEHNLKHPFHFIYYSFIIYFLLPSKIIEIFRHWYLLPFIILLYTVITYITNWKVRSRWMLLFPFYALFQVLVLVWFGVYRYIQTIFRSKNIGRIKMKHNPNNISFFHPEYAINNISSYFIALSSTFLLIMATNGFAQTSILGRRYEATELALEITDFTASKTGETLAFIFPGKEEGSVAGFKSESYDGVYDIKTTGKDNLQIASEAIDLFGKEYNVKLTQEIKDIAMKELINDPGFPKISQESENVQIAKELIKKHIT
ncbi:hypothetical protein A2716_04410 [candidate division WWE3 bacterium RIFCSPHIGHO2_01_FULL_40_23]|uniref:Glycosyltransferase 2-like domain-containing protein n=1 Tax=candidate division WWE3 bacterium RIFCSPLOWO2_01_FULL_41_18 TaxID=1802625 RepID=A0A1F4VD90_UNCKA|nr:MAG: hypothetical protein A2716_04410 [candidate division WWE3 bacterium RIFCSPHIGHO2_01_FULL_40_23]OGC55117.1 MAG: hypothetical protein A3A78_04020 [candidate division WWE3 bacterium RIFCSPLOWO2_01_FULL_41_18]